MLKSLAISQIYVLDQKAALDFYVGKLGLVVNTDQDLGFMRWLTVSVPGDKSREILLRRPGGNQTRAKPPERVEQRRRCGIRRGDGPRRQTAARRGIHQQAVLYRLT